MPIYRVKSGKGGRPLTIDPSIELSRLMGKLPKIQARLANLREQTSGERSESVFGSPTSLPGFLQSSIDVLQAMESGATINYATARQLRQNLRTAYQLSSPQARVYGRALTPILSTDYTTTLENVKQRELANDFIKKQYEEIQKELDQLTPQQQQRYYISEYYQDPLTTYTDSTAATEAIAWAEKEYSDETGQKQTLTREEAFAYILKRKIKKFKNIIK